MCARSKSSNVQILLSCKLALVNVLQSPFNSQNNDNSKKSMNVLYTFTRATFPMIAFVPHVQILALARMLRNAELSLKF